MNEPTLNLAPGVAHGLALAIGGAAEPERLAAALYALAVLRRPVATGPRGRWTTLSVAGQTLVVKRDLLSVQSPMIVEVNDTPKMPLVFKNVTTPACLERTRGDGIATRVLAALERAHRGELKRDAITEDLRYLRHDRVPDLGGCEGCCHVFETRDGGKWHADVVVLSEAAVRIIVDVRPLEEDPEHEKATRAELTALRDVSALCSLTPGLEEPVSDRCAVELYIDAVAHVNGCTREQVLDEPRGRQLLFGIAARHGRVTPEGVALVLGLDPQEADAWAAAGAVVLAKRKLRAALADFGLRLG